MPFEEEGDSSVSHSLFQMGRLTFKKFDVNQVMANSAHLLGSEGREYNTDESLAGKGPIFISIHWIFWIC